MLKKAAGGEGSLNLKEQTQKLKVKLDKNLEFAANLIKQTGMPVQAPNPPDSVLDNLKEECQDHEFWANFKNAAAIIFCGVVDQKDDMRQVRELSFSEELTKTRNMIDSLIAKIEEGDANVDIIQVSLAVNLLENKMKLLKALS